MQHPPVQADLAAMRIRDRIDEGAVAAGYTADRNAVLQLLAGHADDSPTCWSLPVEHTAGHSSVMQQGARL
jgi:hypothetical protein